MRVSESFHDPEPVDWVLETGELSEAITRYAQFNIKYEQLELLHEPGFKSFPHELVEVLFLKRYGFDISFYQVP